MTGTVIIHLWK